MKKTEKRLRRELRMIGFDPQAIADRFDVTRETVNNWISGRTFIPPVIVVKLKEMGVPRKALLNPSEEV